MPIKSNEQREIVDFFISQEDRWFLPAKIAERTGKTKASVVRGLKGLQDGGVVYSRSLQVYDRYQHTGRRTFWSLTPAFRNENN